MRGRGLCHMLPRFPRERERERERADSCYFIDSSRSVQKSSFIVLNVPSTDRTTCIEKRTDPKEVNYSAYTQIEV